MTEQEMVQAQIYMKASLAVRSVMDLMIKDEQDRVVYADYWMLESLAATLEIKAKGVVRKMEQWEQRAK